MVFEAIVAEVLNQFLSQFIENVDKKQLSISIWGGDVVLEKVILKEDALNNLDFPVRTTYGHLGKLVLKIPWKNLYTAPVIISIESLYLLAVPNRDVVYDPEQEQRLKQQAKQRELKRIEEAKKQSGTTETTNIDPTFVEKLVAQIIKNIQIKINNIHVRYEDRISHPEKPFAIGVTLNHLYLYSTDATWTETLVAENAKKINKVMVIDSLAIYWNCNTRLLKTSLPNGVERVLKIFSSTICTKDFQPENYHYILGPINATVRLLLNTRPELDNFELPKYDLNIQLNSLALGLNRFQYHDVIMLTDSLNRLRMSTQYRKYRPDLNVYKGHYRQWWTFAFTCILEEFVRPNHITWTWEHIAEHRAKCHEYAFVYQSKLRQSNFTPDVETRLRELETDLDVFNIVLIREQVEMELEKTKSFKQEIVGSWWEWVNSFQIIQWFRGVETNADTTDVQLRLGKMMSSKEKAKLYKAIGYDARSQSLGYPRTFVNIRVHFNLKTFEIKITDSLNIASCVLHVKLSQVKIDFEGRPTNNGIKVNMGILKLVIYGLEQETFTPVLVESKEVDKEKLLEALFEMNPLDGKCDHRLHIYFRALQIVFDLKTITKVIEIFRASTLKSFSRLQYHIENVKHMSVSGLRYAIEQRKELDLKVDSHSSYIIIPNRGIFTRNEDLLIINLGQLRVNSSPKSLLTLTKDSLVKKGISMHRLKNTLITHSYEKFILNLDFVQILISLKGEDWLQVLKENIVTSMHILKPVSMVAIFNKCLVQDDPTLSKRKLTLSIPSVEITISNTRLLRVLVLLYTILLRNIEDDEQIEAVELEKTMQKTISLHERVMWATKSVRYIPPPPPPLPPPQEEGDELEDARANQKKVQAFLLDLQAQIDNVSVIFFLCPGRASLSIPSPLLTLKLIKMELQIVQHTFNIDITARLGGVCADGYVRKRATRIISTPMADSHGKTTEYLFVLNYNIVDKESPELVSKHDGVLKFLKINFANLNLVLYQEVIVELLNIIESFVESLKKELESLQADVVTAKASKTILKETRGNVSRMYEKPTALVRSKSSQDSLETDFILEANLNKLIITVANVSKAVVDIGVEQCYFKMILNQTKTNIILRLETIQLIDCLKHTHILHRRILSVIGEEAMYLEITIYNRENCFTQSEELCPDVDFSAKIACIRIVYINRLFSLLFNCYNNMQIAIMSFISSAFGKTSDESDENIVNEEKDASYVKMNIDIDAPILIVPINSKSLEAVMLDFGFLTITNELRSMEIENSDGVRPFVDYLTIRFSNVRVNRVTLTEEYELLHDISMIEPVSFSIQIERNLSLSWYRSIPNFSLLMKLHMVNVILTEDDYKLIMKIMTQNFSETYAVSSIKKSDEFQAEKEESLHRHEHIAFDVDSGSEITLIDRKEDEETIVFTLQFIVDTIRITLYEGGTNLHRRFSFTTTKSLTRFTIETLLVQCVELSGGKTTWTFRIVNCFLDDELRDQSTRLFQRKDDVLESNDSFADSDDVTALVNVTTETKNKLTLTDISGHSFLLIVSLEYVLKMKEFFFSYKKDADGISDSEDLSQPSSTNFIEKSLQNISVPELDDDTYNFVNMKLEKSEIFVVESIIELDCDALTTSIEIESTIKMGGDSTVLNFTLKDIYLNSCCFNSLKRKSTTSLILRPCNISVVASAFKIGSINVDVCLTDIKTSLSPKIVDICKKMIALFSENVSKTEETNIDTDYSGIWKPRPLSENEFWFLKAKNTFSISDKDTHSNIRLTQNLKVAANETCVISVPSITIFIEAEEERRRLPLLFVETKIDCIIYDWSTNLLVSSNLFLKIEFYNYNLGMWEPFIEPIEKLVNNENVLQLWELKVEFQMNQSEQTSENDLRASVSVNISSREKLELTFTKTSIGVLTNCANLLLESTEKDFSSSGGALAPYLLKNMSGLQVLVILSKGTLQHATLPYSKAICDYLLPVGAQLEMKIRNEELLRTDSDKVEFNADSLNVFTYRFLKLKVKGFDDNCLKVPVFRSDIRYFSLKHEGEYGDLWGLLWEVKVFEGSTILVLRGILQIYNHLRQPVHVHYLPKEGAPLVRVGTVLPYSELILPPDAIYTETGALFFNVTGYKITKEPFMWKDLKKTPNISKLLQCNTAKPRAGEPLFLNILGTSKKVYFENTANYTSESYAYEIRIQPSVMVKNLLPVDIIVGVLGSQFEEQITIKAGEQMQMANVQPNISQLYVTIPSYMNSEWKSVTNIEWHQEVIQVLRLMIVNDANTKQFLEIRIFTKEKKGTVWKELSSQFWLVNKTGISLTYRQCNKQENMCAHDRDFRDVVIFSFWGSSKANKLSIRMLNGEWSKKMSLDAAGSSGVVRCKVGKEMHYIGVHISLTYTKLTKQVTFIPYYVLLNNHQMGIQCQEVDSPVDTSWIDVKPGDCTPFWPLSSSNCKELVVRIVDSTCTSAPFSYSTAHTTLIQLCDKFGGVFVDIHKMEGAICVTFWPYKPGLAPSLFINCTPYPISVCQKNDDNASVLNSQEIVLFTWKKPTGSRTVMFKVWDNFELADDLQKDGVQELSLKPGNIAYWVSFLDGTQRVTLFTTNPELAYNVQTLSRLEPVDTQLTLSINTVGISFVNNTIMKEIFYVSVGSYDATWQSRKLNKKRFRNLPSEDSELLENAYKKYQEEIMLGRDINTIIKLGTQFVVDLEKNELIQPSRMFLRRTFQEGLWVQMELSLHQITFHGKLSKLQIDNQLTSSVFPVMLAPVPPPKSVSEDRVRKPFVEWSIVRRYMEHSPSVKHYKYFMILIQAFHVKLEMDFLKALSEMFDWEEQPEDVQVGQFSKDLLFAMEPLRTDVDSASTQEEKSFFDILHFSPLKIHLSFSLFSSQEQDLNENTLPFIMIILQGLGVTLTDVHNVVLKLDYFQRQYTFLSYKQMLTEVSSHYISQILKQTYVLVLGLDLIGNPWGLLMGMRQGVSDLFYEPYQGAIQGPGEFVEGVQLGVRRMFGNTLGGTVGAFSHISSAIGTGISVLTFDNRFQYRRLQTMNQATGNVPRAVVQCGKDLAMGVVEGVSGVVTSPVSGARQEGVRGFFKGVGKGVLGLVVRPVIGVFDFIGGSLRAVSLAADVNRQVNRVRPSRYLAHDGLVRVYRKAQSEGQMLLAELKEGRFAETDTYEYHLPGINESKDILLLTDKRIMHLKPGIFVKYSVAWQYTWNEINMPTSTKQGIIITPAIKLKKKLISRSYKNEKFISIKNNKQKVTLLKIMQQILARQNITE